PLEGATPADRRSRIRGAPLAWGWLMVGGRSNSMADRSPASDDAVARDAWLREALRHAPDADVRPPPALRDAILRQARIPSGRRPTCTGACAAGSGRAAPGARGPSRVDGQARARRQRRGPAAQRPCVVFRADRARPAAAGGRVACRARAGAALVARRALDRSW